MSSLAAALLAVRADHGDACDLDHPGTPSATVCLLREGGEEVDYLVLCDSPLVLDVGGRVEVISDDRLDDALADLRRIVAGLPAGEIDSETRFRQAVQVQRERMNRTHGYWVAATDPDAAYHAVTGNPATARAGRGPPGGAALGRRVQCRGAVRPVRLGRTARPGDHAGTWRAHRPGTRRRARPPRAAAPAQARRRRLGGALRVPVPNLSPRGPTGAGSGRDSGA